MSLIDPYSKSGFEQLMRDGFGEKDLAHLVTATAAAFAEPVPARIHPVDARIFRPGNFNKLLHILPMLLGDAGEIMPPSGGVRRLFRPRRQGSGQMLGGIPRFLVVPEDANGAAPGIELGPNEYGNSIRRTVTAVGELAEMGEGLKYDDVFGENRNFLIDEGDVSLLGVRARITFDLPRELPAHNIPATLTYIQE